MAERLLNLYSGFRFSEAYWNLSDKLRSETRSRLVEALSPSAEATHWYQVFPARSDIDFLVWNAWGVEDGLAPIQAFGGFEQALQPFRRLLLPAQSLWGFTRASTYSRGKSEQDMDPLEGPRSPYLIVYPFSKTKEWYLMSMDARQGMMNEHIKIGKQFFDVKQLLLYSFGLQDQEFVVSYETNDLTRFSELVNQLRDTEGAKVHASRHADHFRHLSNAGGIFALNETASRTVSETLFKQAVELMPGGVNSPVRAFKAVGGTPIFFERARGARLYDVDSREYIDYVASWGAIIHGHADAETVEAISNAACRGTSYGAPHEGEIRLAHEVIDRAPTLDRVRFVNSGTEATVAAVRLARAATGRDKIVKLEGCYHGAADCLLAKAGSGVATFGLPDTSGVPAAAAGDTLVGRYNDRDGISALLEANQGSVAAVLVEPVAGNMGLVPPAPGFLEGLRRLCDAHGALLIFDEVMTGFRVDRGGAAARFGIAPDILCFGKIIGGGLPVGAYGARKELMDLVAPVGPMYQAGTLSGNPLAMAAGWSALSRLDEDSYARLESLGARMELGLRQGAQSVGVAAQVQRVGSMISVFFVSEPVNDFDHANRTDKALFGRLFHAMLHRGFYLPPSALESWFLTLAHTRDDIDQTVDAFVDSLRETS